MSDIGYNDVRPEVKAFAVLMEQRLRANDHKGGWKDCSPGHLYEKFVEERWEFEQVLVRAWLITFPAEAVGHEAADVANLAMMNCDHYGALPKVQP